MAELLREITSDRYGSKNTTKKTNDLYERLEDENELYDDIENTNPKQY